MPAAAAPKQGTGGGPGAGRGSAASSSRPKHPHGRRNTYIGTYTRAPLGYSTAGREESLTTTKFRNLSSRERRLYTMTLGYGLRDDSRSGGLSRWGKRQRKPDMSRGHAVALMARLQEMLLHGGRTVEGVFEALALDPR